MIRMSLKYMLGLPHDVSRLYSASAWCGKVILTTDKGIYTLQTDQPKADWVRRKTLTRN